MDLTTSDVEEQSPPPKRLKTLPNSHSYGSHVNTKSTLDDPFLLDPSNPLHQEDVETSVEEVRPTARNNKTIKTPERPLRVYGYSPHQNTGADEPVTPEEERAKKALEQATAEGWDEEADKWYPERRTHMSDSEAPSSPPQGPIRITRT